MAIAFLDFDETLLAGDSNVLWFQYLRDHALIGASAHARHDEFLVAYHRGELDFPALHRFREGVDAELPGERLPDLRHHFARTRLLPALAEGTRNLVQQLRHQTRTPVIISATRAVLIEPVAAYLGVGTLLTPDTPPSSPETGLPPCFGAGKVLHAQSWLHQQAPDHHQSTLTDCWFYSDSHNDLPLLEAVGHPVAVDPDPLLARHAQERGWPIISLRSPQ